MLANESIPPGGDRGGRRHALALEEADVDREPRGDGRQREVHVAGRELHRVDGAEPEIRADRAERRGRLREPRRLRDDRADDDPAPDRVTEARRERVPVDAGREREQRKRGEQQEADLDHRAPGDPAQPDEPGLLRVDERGRLLAQLVDVDPGRLRRVLERALERGRLEVGQELGDALPCRVPRPPQRAPRSAPKRVAVATRSCVRSVSSRSSVAAVVA